jgi:hypothetical protein
MLKTEYLKSVSYSSVKCAVMRENKGVSGVWSCSGQAFGPEGPQDDVFLRKRSGAGQSPVWARSSVPDRSRLYTVLPSTPSPPLHNREDRLHLLSNMGK